MKVITTNSLLNDFVHLHKTQHKTIAFVPTMGALHNGHISLVAQAKKDASIVICSIFVNPTQFTDPKDLEKYPRPLEHDIAMLEAAGCDAVFMPGVQEMYPTWPKPEDWDINLGPAEFLLEGEFRPGHYQGVTQIVKKLFDAVQPDVAYFGQKDFQQVLMIRKMVEVLRLPVKIISCPIVREADGLAMSSRNIHLSATDRQHALVLNQALTYITTNFGKSDLVNLLKEASELIESTVGVSLEYLSIADRDTLLPKSDHDRGNAVALVAAKVGNTRLIDNMLL